MCPEPVYAAAGHAIETSQGSFVDEAFLAVAWA